MKKDGRPSTNVQVQMPNGQNTPMIVVTDQGNEIPGCWLTLDQQEGHTVYHEVRERQIEQIGVDKGRELVYAEWKAFGGKIGAFVVFTLLMVGAIVFISNSVYKFNESAKPAPVPVAPPKKVGKR